MKEAKPKILIRGYYGFGNLGDDVLMITTYNMIKEIFPHSAPSIFSNSLNTDYFSTLLNTPIEIVSDQSNAHFDIIIDGGGGVYFDFESGKWYFLFINKLIRLIGYKTYNSVLAKFKKVTGGASISARISIGIGIGVGTFTPSSKKFYVSIRKLSQYNLLVVRDADSLINVEKVNIKADFHIATDLAFLNKYWLPLTTAIKPGLTKQREIGIVVRNWANDKGIQEWIKSKAELLKSRGGRITIFIFEMESDKNLISYYNQFEVKVWNPSEVSLDNYLIQFAQMDIILTMRAHGAILGACLGVPSICLAVEPKLEVVARMLKTSASILYMNEDDRNFIKLCDLTMERRQETLNDVTHNVEIMEKGIQLFNEYIQHKTEIN